MLKYILKRILIFIPTLLIISVLAFGLSKMAPGDPLEDLVPEGLEISPKQYQRLAKSSLLDLPAFYFKFTSLAYPKNLYTYIHRNERIALTQLIAQYGNWPRITIYSQQIDSFQNIIKQLPKGIGKHIKSKVLPELRLLKNQYEGKAIRSNFRRIDRFIQEDSTITPVILATFTSTTDAYGAIVQYATTGKLYTPVLYWYGHNNQYHKWFSKFLVGDFGISKIDQQPIAKKLWPSLKLTLLLNVLAIFFAFLLSIPLGVYLAVKKGERVDKLTSIFLFMLYSLPSFWVATMLIIFVTTPQYGMDWFPTLGLGDLPEGTSSWTIFWDKAWHLVLPVFCLTYGILAVITQQMRGAMSEVLGQDFIRTAKAKGLAHKKVVWKHAFRNALFPIITMFASVFPAAIAGSVIIESIFNIYGMGWQILNAIVKEDWAVVYAILMLSSILTMVGILIADILYAVVDPRISLKK